MQLKRKEGRVTAKDVQELLKKEFAVEYALKTVYKVLKRAVLSRVNARLNILGQIKRNKRTLKKI